MILYPAVDIRGGQTVRLKQGDFEQETIYDSDPLEAAKRWDAEGAEWLHIVDLDGAREGKPVNLDHVWRIAEGVAARIQFGGGLRDSRSVADALDVGVERLVLGTAALRDPGFLGEMLENHEERVVVSIDARGDRAAVEGWTEEEGGGVEEELKKLNRRGVGRFVYTQIDVDGTMEGPRIDELKRIAPLADGQVIYSGGIGSTKDLEALAGAGIPNLEGAIVGRALYDGEFTLPEASAALSGG